MPRGTLEVWLVLLAAVLVRARPATELSSTAILFYNSDYQPMYSPLSQCELLVRRAARHGGRRVQLIPTHYWYDRDNEALAPDTCNPDAWAKQNKVDYFCRRDEWNSPCLPFDAAALHTFRAGIKACLKVAFELFDEVLVAPHLDDGLKRGAWRNMLHFDPLWRDAHNVSYFDILLRPILDAANEVVPAGKTLWFAVEGEMGGTVMSYPGSYLEVYRLLRKYWVAAGRLRVGLTLNHAYIMGHINRGPSDLAALPPSAMAAYDGGFGPVLPFASWPNHARAAANLMAIRALLERSDFLGISTYSRAPSAAVTPRDIESSTAKVAQEFGAMGIDLAAALRGKVLMFSEFGLGGGLSECGDTPGTDSKIGAFPWLGITHGYSPDADPFKPRPGTAGAAPYLLAYYRAALGLLAAGGADWPVHHAYLWNCVSWDVQGLHTASALWNTDVDQGDWPVRNGFAVQEAIDLIKAHNAAANAARPAAQPLEPPRQQPPPLPPAPESALEAQLMAPLPPVPPEVAAAVAGSMAAAPRFAPPPGLSVCSGSAC